MKVINIFFPLLAIFIAITPSKAINNTFIRDECDISNFYEVIEPESNIKVLTSNGDLKEAELILVPTKIEEGTYKIEITREGHNIYKIEETNYYIETRYCYEYAIYEDAILTIESNYGYTKGTVSFK